MRAVEAVGNSAGVEVGKFAGSGAEYERLPVLPGEQIDAALDTDTQPCVAADENTEPAWLLWLHSLQAQ